MIEPLRDARQIADPVAAAGLVQAALILAAPAVGHGLVAVRSLRGSGLG